MKHITKLMCVTAFFLSTSCTKVPKEKWDQKTTVQYVPQKKSFPWTPTFVVERADVSWNKIGTPKNESVSENPATCYYEKEEFQTKKATYTNYIYRVHFPKVPSYYLTGGNNGGLLVLVTCDQKDRPLLVTTVHTCGCFLHFFPTSLLDKAMYPKEWKEKIRQKNSVISDLEAIPGIVLDVKDKDDLVLFIAKNMHQVSDIVFQSKQSLQYPECVLQMAPMIDLRKENFFDSNGYVKNNTKLNEFLLMSWWTFDSKIGQDKDLSKDGPVFYTRLKPGAKKASDMRDFAQFLSYWGWGL